MFNVKFEELTAPFGVKVRIISYLTTQEANFTVSHENLVNNPTAFFGEARHALTLMAREIAAVQSRLEKANQLDVDRAMRNYASGNYSVPSFRPVGLPTAALVYGVPVDHDMWKHGEQVNVDLEPFDIVIGKVNKTGSTWRGMGDFKTDFLLQDPSENDITPGTKYILHSLQKVAREIESYYKYTVVNPKPALPITSAPFDTKFKDINETDKLKRQIKKLLREQQEREEKILASQQHQDIVDEDITKKLIDSVKKARPIILPNDYPGPITFQTPLTVPSGAKPGDTTTGRIRLPDDGKSFSVTENIPESRSSWHDCHILFTDAQGRLAAALLANPKFSARIQRSLVNPNLPDENLIEVTGGTFKIKDAVIVDPDALINKSTVEESANDPNYWAYLAENKINYIKGQVLQNLPEEDPTRILICAISDLMSDHIYNMEPEIQEP